MMKIVGVLLMCLCTFTFADDEEVTRMPSACELDRERRLGATTPASLHLIPSCDANGDYSALQCFTGLDWCVCYRRNGENINTPSKSIKACDCVRARDDAITNGDDYKPRCTKDGYYRPKQCKGSECWCVDKDGNQKSDPTTGDVNC